MRHSADLWHFAAGLVRGLEGSTHNALSENALGLVLREPIGVVGVVTPWNYPLVIGSERLPWALGAGCTAVIKPSEYHIRLNSCVSDSSRARPDCQMACSTSFPGTAILPARPLPNTPEPT